MLKKKIDLSLNHGLQYENLLLSLLVIVVILIYTDTLTTPFIFDDINNIRDNPHIRIPALTLKNLAWAGFESPEDRRPVANISFALNYFMHGYNLVGFHLVNIVIHIGVGLCLFSLAKASLMTPVLYPIYGKLGWIPFFTAFIWMVHPLQTQSVAYLVQRMNSLAAFFYVLSLLLYVKFRLSANKRARWLLFCGCLLAALLAFGTKEITATLPVFIILYEWFFFQGLKSKRAGRHFVIFGAALLIMIVIALIYMNYNPLARILAGYKFRDYTILQRVLTELRVVIFYISLLLWPQPSRLNLDHDFALSHSLTDPPTTLFALLLISALLLTAVLISRREPLLAYAIFWFFGNLVIESSVIGLELVFEHRNYLPSTFVILALVALLFRYLKPTYPGVVGLCVVGTLFCFWTYERNRVWADEISLYRDCAEKSPQKARPHNNLGAGLSRRGRLAEAIAHYQTALTIRPDYADAHYNLGYAFIRQGKLQEGIHHFSESLRYKPRNLKAHNNLGAALVIQGRYPEAIDHFRAALKINPRDEGVHYNLGYALKKQGNSDAAIQHFKRALTIDPRHAAAHNNLALILMDKGQFEAAYHHFSRALEISPNYEEALNNLKELQKRWPQTTGSRARSE